LCRALRTLSQDKSAATYSSLLFSFSPSEVFMATLPQDPIPARAVNVYVPREIAFDLGKMTRITANVLDRLGCGGCHSGRILNFHTLEDFIVNPKTLEVEEFAGRSLGR
jgi:hypothetical protein